jgi:transcriptional regulator with XRE-family HTH domain
MYIRSIPGTHAMATLPPTADHQYQANLRRLMARQGVTIDELVERTGIDGRTVRAMLAGKHKPHAKTLHRLAAGLGVQADEFFQDPSLLAYRSFDRATNPIVDEVVEAHPRLFAGWSQHDFDELYSRFGTGGGLTAEGTLAVVKQMNRKHELMRKVAVLLESNESELLAEMIEVLYKRAVVN